MYSYFVFLTFIDGSFFSLNVCSGLNPDQVATWIEEFFKAVDARLAELRRPERVKNARKFRILLDKDEQHTFPGRAITGDFDE